MSFRVVLGPLKWLMAIVVFYGLFKGASWVHDRMTRERPRQTSADISEAPQRARKGQIKMSAELAKSHGIEVREAQAVVWSERVPVLGRVVPNPKATAEVRAPFAGTLRAAPDHPWPTPGGIVRVGQVLGKIDLRVGPQEKLDLVAKINNARLEQQGAEKILKIQQERAAGLKGLKENDIVSRKEYDDVLVDLAKAETALKTAKETYQLWQAALAEINGQGELRTSTWSLTLNAPADGEVTELAGRPGMVVEAGGLVARLVDFRQTLVRLDIPAEALSAGPPAQVELITSVNFRGATNRSEADSPTRSADAVLVGAAPQVDATSQFLGYLYEVTSTSAYQVAQRTPNPTPSRPEESNPSLGIWRPGLLVKALLKVPGAKPRPAVLVPASALLYHQGRALVYVRLSSGKTERYERREVQVLGREGDNWVLAAGVSAGEEVVARQAQVLLSEEFKGDVDND
jgi:biotin carboxyl carrier protein